MKEAAGSANLGSIWKLFVSFPPHEMACMTQTFGFSHADFFIPTLSIRTLLVAHVRHPVQISLDKVGREGGFCSCLGKKALHQAWLDLGLKCGHWTKVDHPLLSLFLCVSFTLGPWVARWSLAAPELQGEGTSLSQQRWRSKHPLPNSLLRDGVC